MSVLLFYDFCDSTGKDWLVTDDLVDGLEILNTMFVHKSPTKYCEIL
jgi:hypothetical protein